MRPRTHSLPGTLTQIPERRVQPTIEGRVFRSPTLLKGLATPLHWKSNVNTRVEEDVKPQQTPTFGGHSQIRVAS